MAKTEYLMTLIEEYPTAFEDPEAVVTVPVAPNLTESVENQSPTEPDKVSTDDEMTDADWCQMYLLQLEYEPSLMTIAAKFLEELATVADLRKHVATQAPIQKVSDIVIRKHPTIKPVQTVADIAITSTTLDLPETYARQGTADCVHGNCPLDH
jgi:hypothetical protein